MANMNLERIGALSFAVLLGMTAASYAQSGYQAPPRQPTVEVPARGTAEPSKPGEKEVRASLVTPLNDAVSLGKKGDLQGALAKAKEADAAAPDKSPYEEYVVSKFIGQFAGQLHDNATAAAAFDRALASGAMPEEERPQILRVDMGVNINAGNYAKAVIAGEELRKLGKADGDVLSDLSLAYYQKGDFTSALKTARASVDAQTANGSAPREQTLKILMNAQVKTGDQMGAKQTHDRLCAMTPPPSDMKCGPPGGSKKP